MGIVSEVKSVVESVGHAIGSAWSYTKNSVSKIANAIGSGTKTVYSDAKSAVTAVYQEGSKVTNTVIGDVSGLANKGVDDVSSLGHSVLNTIEIPLILIGGGVLLFLMSSGKNSAANVSYNR
jgi:hypothetical protein